MKRKGSRSWNRTSISNLKRKKFKKQNKKKSFYSLSASARNGAFGSRYGTGVRIYEMKHGKTADRIQMMIYSLFQKHFI
jgi:thymidylate synthase